MLRAAAYSNTLALALRLLVDTGASTTTFAPHFVEELELRQNDRTPEAEMIAMTGAVTAGLFILPRLRALGQTVVNLSIAAVDIPPEAGVDGVLGFDFLKRFRVAINATRGVVVAQLFEIDGLVNRLRDRLEWMRIA